MYTISYPSGTLRNEGVVIEQNDNLQPYRDYVAWLHAGNGPTPIADQEFPPVRQHITISPWQLRKALNAQGLRQTVEDFVTNSGDKDLQDAYEFATEWQSDNPLLLSKLGNIGMTEDAMYALFELAATL